MRKLAFGALMIGLLSAAACGGGGTGPTLIDGSTTADAPATACDPIAQTGCAANQKCTWVFLDQNFTSGAVACADLPATPIATDADCTFSMVGSVIVDNCVAGDLCSDVGCQPICNSAATTDSCTATGKSCTLTEGEWTGTSPQLGSCAPLCNPVTQQDLNGNDQCNSPKTNGVPDGSRACYRSGQSFTCEGVPTTVKNGTGMYGDTQRAYGPMGSNLGYSNGCQPGYVLGFNDPTNTFRVCYASCTPQVTYLNSPAPQNPSGVSPHSCLDASGINGDAHDCLFWSSFFQTAYVEANKAFGFCYDYGSYSDVSCSTADPAVDNTGGGASGTASDGIPDYQQGGCSYPGNPANPPLRATPKQDVSKRLLGDSVVKPLNLHLAH